MAISLARRRALHQVSLDVGENTIEVFVTSEGKQGTRTYTVKVTRIAASDATLTALSLVRSRRRRRHRH